MLVCLSELAIGELASVVSFEKLGAAARQKLFALGLLPGTRLALKGRAPWGGALHIELESGISLGLRKAEGSCVTVQRQS